MISWAAWELKKKPPAHRSECLRLVSDALTFKIDYCISVDNSRKPQTIARSPRGPTGRRRPVGIRCGRSSRNVRIPPACPGPATASRASTRSPDSATGTGRCTTAGAPYATCPWGHDLTWPAVRRPGRGPPCRICRVDVRSRRGVRRRKRENAGNATL